MLAGQLNRTIQIQQRSSSTDEFGQPIQAWTTIRTCRASIDIQASALIYETATFVSKATHRITMRWSSCPIIMPDMRIIYSEPSTGIVHTYNIETLLNTKQANVELVALCYELDGAE
jgi:SPP1 family predicted phage head-tail adaptor